MRKTKTRKRASARKKSFQKIWHDYEREHRTAINDPEDVARWAIATHRYEEAPPTPLQRCKKELTRAIRDEYIEDEKGREARLMHAVPKTVGGQQVWEWGRIYDIPPARMRVSLQHRRRATLADCRQHKIDTESYNDYNEYGAQLPLFDYNFNLDLEEERLAEEGDQQADQSS